MSVIKRKREFFKTALSTRRVMQGLPPLENIHYISPDELVELQKCMLEMIKDIDRVCTEHDICYLAAGGTCLGSVRHRGFIPWDDDVDLLMPRTDLKRFLKIFESEMGDRYQLTSPASDFPLESLITAVYKRGTYRASVQTYGTDLPKGVHIDIFTIENVPRNRLLRRLKGTYATFIQYIAVSTLFKGLTNEKKREFFCQTPEGRFNYAFRMFIANLFSFFSYERWARIYDRAVSMSKDTGYCTVPTDIRHYFGHVMPKDVYLPPSKGPFEDMEINMPHDPDRYLKNQYGDYMKIPKESEREAHWSIGFSLTSGEEQ